MKENVYYILDNKSVPVLMVENMYLVGFTDVQLLTAALSVGPQCDKRAHLEHGYNYV